MRRNLIVVGASAGGIEPLRRMITELPADLAATVLVTVHVPANSHSALPKVIGRHAALQVRHATGAHPLTPGLVLIAPPDHHLLVERDHVRLTRGPRENGHRPAIDPMFRTAARWSGPRVIGVILSGALDDGTAGLLAVALRGGATVVQHPEDAQYAGMPESALRHVPTSHAVRAEELATTLMTLVNEELPEEAMTTEPKEQLLPENEDVGDAPEKDAKDDREGVPSGLSCPDCHGVLWEVVDGELVRFRCRVGHAFSPASLDAYQHEHIEEALWAAYRALEESASMAARLADKMRQQGFPAAAKQYDERREDALSRARLIFSAIAATGTTRAAG